MTHPAKQPRTFTLWRFCEQPDPQDLRGWHVTENNDLVRDHPELEFLKVREVLPEAELQAESKSVPTLGSDQIKATEAER